MVSPKELRARIKKYFRFTKQEIGGLVPAILVTGFIFSFRDWGGDQISVAVGLNNLFLAIILAAIAFFFRLSFQKISALGEGYDVEFKVWWAGLIIALVVTFFTLGLVPLVFAGSLAIALRVKHRLGEFRHGFSHKDAAIIGLSGTLGSMILAIIFAVLAFFMPESYFFSKGVLLNLVMGFTMLLPLPQLEGLSIFFGSRPLYFLGVGVVLLNSLLLLSGTKFGLILAVVIGTIGAIVYILTGSEK